MSKQFLILLCFLSITTIFSDTDLRFLQNPDLMVYNSSIGLYLVDSSGRTLYINSNDNQSSNSTCYGTCAATFPPFIKGSPVISAMIPANMVKTMVRTDNSVQVVFNGYPLYYYISL